MQGLEENNQPTKDGYCNHCNIKFRSRKISKDLEHLDRNGIKFSCSFHCEGVLRCTFLVVRRTNNVEQETVSRLTG